MIVADGLLDLTGSTLGLYFAGLGVLSIFLVNAVYICNFLPVAKRNLANYLSAFDILMVDVNSLGKIPFVLAQH